jgi:hypothetical protein
MNKQRLLDIVKTAWQAYSNIPLQLSSDTLSKSLASELVWCTCAGMEPGRRSLLLCISRSAATDLAATMFALPTEETTDANIEDAVGEVVNIVAGQIESEFNYTGRLGLPVRVSSNTFLNNFQSLPIEFDLLLQTNNQPFYIAIVSEEPIGLFDEAKQ